MLWIGIDPGKTGGIAAIDGGKVVNLTQMPGTEHQIVEVFDKLTGMDPQLLAAIEQVHAMPKQGVSSTFKFGMGYGVLRGIMVAYGVPFFEVPPRKWMLAFSMSRGKNETTTIYKRRLLGKAENLFPNSGVKLSTADALLIAEYCRQRG